MKCNLNIDRIGVYSMQNIGFQLGKNKNNATLNLCIEKKNTSGTRQQ